jgi:hypothetical protein
MTVFDMMLGTYDPAMFDMDGGVMNGGYITSIFIKTFFVLFMVLVPIVLLNMLIAVMGDSYERVENQVRQTNARMRCIVRLHRPHINNN